MEEYRLEIAPLARQDIAGIWRYIARDNSVAADLFCQRLLGTAELLQQAPSLGSPLRDRKGKRRLVFHSYLIIYEVRTKDRVIKIYRFWHGARDARHLRLREETPRYGQVSAVALNPAIS
jgi:toxin ParE1/3/4